MCGDSAGMSSHGALTCGGSDLPALGLRLLPVDVERVDAHPLTHVHLLRHGAPCRDATLTPKRCFHSITYEIGLMCDMYTIAISYVTDRARHVGDRPNVGLLT